MARSTARTQKDASRVRDHVDRLDPHDGLKTHLCFELGTE